MWYRSRIFRVGGTLDGVAVEGFVGCDEVHLAPGRQNYVDDPLTVTHLSDAWCTWATAYDDGIGRGGPRCVRPRRVRVRPAIDRRRSPSPPPHVAGSVIRDERGFPAHIAFVIDGEAWEFTPTLAASRRSRCPARCVRPRGGSAGWGRPADPWCGARRPRCPLR